MSSAPGSWPGASLEARAAPTPAAALEPVPIARVAGAWEGVYYSYPHPMGLKVTVTETGAMSLEGEVQIYPLRESRGITQAPEGRFSVRGVYDPVLRTFNLTPGAWIERPRQGGNPFVLQGVFDPGGAALAGLFGGPRADRLYFALARPDRASALIRSMIDAATPAPRRPAGRLRGGPDDATLVRWASRLTEEYPDIDPRRTELGRLSALAVNLFEDEHFRRHFGKTFDRMSAAERQAVRARFESTTTISTAHPRSIRGALERRPDEELRQFSALSRAFATGTQGAADVMHMVLAQRVIRSWRVNHLARLDAMPPILQAFEGLDDLLSAAQANLRTLWPSEQVHFGTTLAQTRGRLAVPVLTGIVDELIVAPPGYDAAVALASWDRGRDRLIAAVPPDIGASLAARTSARLDEVLEELMTSEVASFDGFGTGLAAVEAGTRWLAELRARYGFAMERRAVRAAVAQLQARRAQDLAGAASEIGERIQAQSTVEGVDAVVGALLAVPGDAESSAGGVISDYAERRKASIHRAQMVAQLAQLLKCVDAYEAQDYSTAASACQLPAQQGNPSAQGILGNLYAFGRGVPVDMMRARALHEQACKGGNAMSCFNLGMMVTQGARRPQDLARARALFEQACSGQIANGCYNLGVMVQDGHGGVPDPARARALFEQACKGGVTRACSELEP